MNKTKTILLAITLLSLAGGSAIARDRDEGPRCRGDIRHCWSAPEIDPAQALGALTLLTGTIAIIRGYRRKK